MFGAGLAIRPDIPLQRAGSQWFSLKLLPMDVMDVVDAEGLDLWLVGKNSEGCSATTSRNEMEVSTKMITRDSLHP